jgi:two-component system nitrogen regulation response regulator GlnG
MPGNADAPVEPQPPAFDLAAMIDGQLRDERTGLYSRVIHAVDRELLTRVLRHTQGHLGQACELLGMDRKTLRNKLREAGIALGRVVSDKPGSEE